MTEKDKKGQGGGLAEEGEFIDGVEMGVEEVRRLETFHNWIFISRWRAICGRREWIALLDFFSPSNGSCWTSCLHEDELTFSSWEELTSLHFLFDLIVNTSLSTNISRLSSAIWSLILINYHRNFPPRGPSKHQFFQFRYFQVFGFKFTKITCLVYSCLEYSNALHCILVNSHVCEILCLDVKCIAPSFKYTKRT